MKPNYILHVICHTHWDKEWYKTFEEFRIMLIELVNNLIDIFREYPDYKNFLLDGQASVIEDYLDIKPEKREIITELVKDGRLSVGPFYVLPDQFLSSEESVIRNLLIGHSMAHSFGKVTKSGYSPDVFGWISQMPQIFRGFDIDNALITRGINPALRRGFESEFWWESSDGSRILGIFSPEGYSNCFLIPDSDRAIKEFLDMRKEIQGRYATTRHLLLGCGNDHGFPKVSITEMIEKGNKLVKDCKILHDSIDGFVEALKEDIRNIKTIKGELRDHGTTIPGVLSSRMYLKIKNKEVSTLLERWAEPFSAFSWILGDTYPGEFLLRAWKLLLRNLAHDSISGCSIDEVHYDMESRFKQIHEIAETLKVKALDSISSRINTSGLTKCNLVIFNPLSISRVDIVIAHIDFEEGGIWGPEGIIEQSKTDRIKDFVIREENRKAVPYQVISKEVIPITKHKRYSFPRVYNITRYTIGFIAEDVPSYGYKTYSVEENIPSHKSSGTIAILPNVLQNKFIRVEIKPNGTLKVKDLENNNTYDNLHYFEDGGDSGDTYHYSSPISDSMVNSMASRVSISLIHNGPCFGSYMIEYRMHLPEGLEFKNPGIFSRDIGIVSNVSETKRSEKKRELIIKSTVTLSSRSRRIDIVTEVDNNVKDHRLRIVFPAFIRTDNSFARGHYDVVTREISLKELPDGLFPNEQPVSTHPNNGFVDVNDGRHGLCILTYGLPEYEVKDDETKAVVITLFRSVGFLSRGAILSRKMCECGYPFSTPDAQCIRKMVFRYAILPHSGTWETSKIYNEAQEFQIPMLAVQTGAHDGDLAVKNTFLKIKPDTMILSAVKVSEDGEFLVIRFFNVSDKNETAYISFGEKLKKAFILNLNEEIKKDIFIEKGKNIKINVRGKEIITLGLEPADYKSGKDNLLRKDER